MANTWPGDDGRLMSFRSLVCEVIQFLKDEVGRLLDTGKSAPLSLIEVLEKKLNCSG